MKQIKWVLLYFLILATACATKNSGDDSEDLIGITSRTPVTLTQVHHGNIQQYIILTATTSYQNKFAIYAPTTAYITALYVQQGEKVKLGEPICKLESKERLALGKEASPNMGVITMNALADGYVTQLIQQKGNYVGEGAQIGTIADLTSFTFLLNVPYEYSKYIEKGGNCTLQLPDGSNLEGKIDNPLTTMNIVSQTQEVKVNARAPFLPEGLVVKATVHQKNNAQVNQTLPRNAVQCDDALEKFWIVKLVNDSLAVHVPIKIGASNKDSVEILSPLLSPNDRIVLAGGYELPDSSLVEIVSN